jgi:hypothetical protein
LWSLVVVCGSGGFVEAHACAHVRNDACVFRIESDAYPHRGLAAIGGGNDGDHPARDLPVLVGIEHRLHWHARLYPADVGLAHFHLDFERVHVHQRADAGAGVAAAG